jgi:hypothetical protein
MYITTSATRGNEVKRRARRALPLNLAVQINSLNCYRNKTQAIVGFTTQIFLSMSGCITSNRLYAPLWDVLPDIRAINVLRLHLA